MTLPAAPYPDPPNCCPHSANAHKRRNCTLCDCEKAPVVTHVAPPPTPLPSQVAAAQLLETLEADQQADQDAAPLDLHRCQVCKALVAVEDREGHLDYHDTLLHTLSSLFESLRLIARLLPVRTKPRTTPTPTEDPK